MTSEQVKGHTPGRTTRIIIDVDNLADARKCLDLAIEQQHSDAGTQADFLR